MRKDRIVLAGLLAALSCVLLWAVMERLGLTTLTGNTVTIFTTLIFFLAALTQVSPDPAQPDGSDQQVSRRSISTILALILLIVFHLLNWLILTLLFDVLWDPLETAVTHGLVRFEPGAREHLRTAIGGTVFMFWSIPLTMIFASWLGVRVMSFSIWMAFIAVAVALGLFVIIRLAVDPTFFAQSSASLALLFQNPNPFVGSTTAIVSIVVVLLLALLAGGALLTWVPMRLSRWLRFRTGG